jgi:hypothetical protein
MNNERLQKIYDKQYQKFIDGYEIVLLEADDCDELGVMYWAVCKNGIGSREWDIDYIKEEDIISYKKKIAEEGIIDPKSKQIYFINPSKYFFSNKIEIISYEEYDKMMELKPELEILLDKYITFLNEEYKQENHGNKWFSESLKLSKTIKKIKDSVLTSVDMMKKTLSWNLGYNKYQKIEEDFKNKIELTERESELWFN